MSASNNLGKVIAFVSFARFCDTHGSGWILKTAVEHEQTKEMDFQPAKN